MAFIFLSIIDYMHTHFWILQLLQWESLCTQSISACPSSEIFSINFSFFFYFFLYSSLIFLLKWIHLLTLHIDLVFFLIICIKCWYSFGFMSLCVYFNDIFFLSHKRANNNFFFSLFHSVHHHNRIVCPLCFTLFSHSSFASNNIAVSSRGYKVSHVLDIWLFKMQNDFFFSLSLSLSHFFVMPSLTCARI